MTGLSGSSGGRVCRSEQRVKMNAAEVFCIIFFWDCAAAVENWTRKRELCLIKTGVGGGCLMVFLSRRWREGAAGRFHGYVNTGWGEEMP